MFKELIVDKNDYCQKVLLTCEPAEYLIIESALKTFSIDKNTRFIDRDIAKRLIHADWTIKEQDT